MIDANLTFVRHGSTFPNEDDFKRRLTPRGIKQALEFRERYLNGIKISTVIASPSDRTIETTKILVGGDVSIMEMPQLYGPTSIGRQDIFEKLGNDSLKEYFKEDKEGVLKEYSERAARILSERLNLSKRGNILIIGHSVISVAIAVEFSINKDPIMETILSECEGIVVEDGIPKYLPISNKD